MNSGSAWNKELNAFKESMTYDHNGNILKLQRNDRQHLLTGVTASYTAQMIDSLIYGYDIATGDRLKNVEDASAQAAGFSNVVNANTVKEFTYDGNGNVTADANKGMTVTYNYLGKPTVINFSGGKKIEYTYDASGNKLRMRILQGTTPLDTTDYVGNYVYDGGKLKYFGSPEGRTIMNGGKPEYQYAIADHQGNTRVVFTSAAQTPSAPVATFEGDANDQSPQYSMGGNVVSFFAANHTPSGIKVVRMNQTTPVGPSKSMKVYPGDKVGMEIWSYFEGSSGWGTSNKGMAALITNVATVFGGVSGGAGESGVIYSAVNTAYSTIGTAGNRVTHSPQHT
jgi:YD repeat-containing protein